MSKERLEAVKMNANHEEYTGYLDAGRDVFKVHNVTLPIEDYEWLISQAERVERLEKELKFVNERRLHHKANSERVQELEGDKESLANLVEETAKISWEIEQQNKRYREAIMKAKKELLNINGEKETRPFTVYGILNEALEGEEE